LTGDRFPLPVNTGRVDGRAFPLAELTGRQLGPSTRVVETGLNWRVDCRPTLCVVTTRASNASSLRPLVYSTLASGCWLTAQVRSSRDFSLLLSEIDDSLDNGTKWNVVTKTLADPIFTVVVARLFHSMRRWFLVAAAATL